MAERNKDTAFWKHPNLRGLGPINKAILTYLETAPASHVLGIYRVSVDEIAADTEWQRQQVLDALVVLSAAGHAHYDYSREIVWVVRMAKWNARGATIWQNAGKHLARMSRSPLVGCFLDYWTGRELGRGCKTFVAITPEHRAELRLRYESAPDGQLWNWLRDNIDGKKKTAPRPPETGATLPLFDQLSTAQPRYETGAVKTVDNKPHTAPHATRQKSSTPQSTGDPPGGALGPPWGVNGSGSGSGNGDPQRPITSGIKTTPKTNTPAPSARAPARKRNGGDLGKLRSSFSSRYAKRHNGAQPTWDRSHLGMLSSLLKAHTREEIERRIGVFFTAPPHWITSWDLSTFRRHFDKFASAAGAGPPAPKVPAIWHRIYAHRYTAEGRDPPVVNSDPVAAAALADMDWGAVLNAPEQWGARRFATLYGEHSARSRTQ